MQRFRLAFQSKRRRRSRATSGRNAETRHQLRFEPLEQRRLLAAGVLNAPDNYQEALVGTEAVIVPTADGPLIDAGSSDAIRGLDNVLGPHLGDGPDVGAYELGLGAAWTGPRSFSDLLAYGLPTGWQVADVSQLAGYASLGAPDNVAANDFRLLLVQGDDAKPDAFILVTFEQLAGEARWTRFDEILQGVEGDQPLVERVEFRDGLGGAIVARGNNAQLLGARVDDEGVLNILGGVAKGDLSKVQGEMFTFIRSLYYAWNLQDAANPSIALDFVAPLTAGFVAVGTDSDPLNADHTIPGRLHGDVTLTSASVIWDIAGDSNENATAVVLFRREGTTEWREALDLARVKYTDVVFTEKSVNRLAGSIFFLSPGTKYEVEVRLTDADGGARTYQTSFTTRSVPKISSPGKVTAVTPADDLGPIMAAAQPGDTILFHAGNYTGNYEYTDRYGNRRQALDIKRSGTYENPILLRPFGDGDVQFQEIWIEGSHIWLDEIHVSVDRNPLELIHAVNAYSVTWPEGMSLTRNTLEGGWFQVAGNGEKHFISDNWLIGDLGEEKDDVAYVSKEGIEFAKGKGRGHVASFNDITKVQDGISYGNGNIDEHNNRIHHNDPEYGNPIELDYAWDNMRVWENKSWDVASGFSLAQPQNGGPFYVIKNQITGSKRNAFKLRSGSGEQYIIANTVVSSRETLNAHQLFRDGGVFANNYWAAFSYRGGPGRLGDGNDPGSSAMALWGYNGYHVTANRVWGWDTTLASLQAKGAEINSFVANSSDDSGPGNQVPVATPQLVVTHQDTALAIQLSGHDPDNEPITFKLIDHLSPTFGTLSDFDLSAGTLTYTPNQGFVGEDSFSFVVSDGKATSQTAVVTIGITPPNTVWRGGLAGHWRFDETGSVVLDSTWSENDGALHGAPQRTDGRLGSALAFDGSNDYVVVQDDSALDLTGPITIALWVQSDSLADQNAGFVSKSGDGSRAGLDAASTAYEFGVAQADLYFKISDGTNFSSVSGELPASLGTGWHHLAASWDGTTDDDGLKIYVDGVETFSAKSAVKVVQSGASNLGFGGKGAGDEPFEGQVDDVSLAGRVLNADEVLALASGHAFVEELLLSIDTETISEDEGTAMAMVARSHRVGDLDVDLINSDAETASLPSSIVIPDGDSTSASFTITGVDDDLLEGPQRVFVTAVAAGHLPGRGEIVVTDWEPLELSIAKDEISQNFGVTYASVSRPNSVGDLLVELGSSDPNIITHVSSVLIEDGKTSSEQFSISATGYPVAEKKKVSIWATAEEHQLAVEKLTILPRSAWQNLNKYDVNDDTVITPRDLLISINDLNEVGPRKLPDPSPLINTFPYFDVSGDGYHSPIDALFIVNYLNALGNGPDGEAVSSSDEGDPGPAALGSSYSDTLEQDSLSSSWGPLGLTGEVHVMRPLVGQVRSNAAGLAVDMPPRLVTLWGGEDPEGTRPPVDDALAEALEERHSPSDAGLYDELADELDILVADVDRWLRPDGGP